VEKQTKTVKTRRSPKATAPLADPVQMDDPWVIIQLSAQGEQEPSHRALQMEIRRLIGECEVFYPWVMARQGYDTPTVYLDGYVFIRDTRDRQYEALSRSALFEGPIARNIRSRSDWSRMSGADIRKMKDKLIDMTKTEFQPGDTVKVTDGPYENLEGVVTAVNRNISVQFTLSFGSREFVVDLEQRVLERQ
jgi:hypothetical protein